MEISTIQTMNEEGGIQSPNPYREGYPGGEQPSIQDMVDIETLELEDDEDPSDSGSEDPSGDWKKSVEVDSEYGKYLHASSDPTLKKALGLGGDFKIEKNENKEAESLGVGTKSLPKFRLNKPADLVPNPFPLIPDVGAKTDIDANKYCFKPSVSKSGYTSYKLVDKKGRIVMFNSGWESIRKLYVAKKDGKDDISYGFLTTQYTLPTHSPDASFVDFKTTLSKNLFEAQLMQVMDKVELDSDSKDPEKVELKRAVETCITSPSQEDFSTVRSLRNKYLDPSEVRNTEYKISPYTAVSMINKGVFNSAKHLSMLTVRAKKPAFPYKYLKKISESLVASSVRNNSSVSVLFSVRLVELQGVLTLNLVAHHIYVREGNKNQTLGSVEESHSMHRYHMNDMKATLKALASTFFKAPLSGSWKPSMYQHEQTSCSYRLNNAFFTFLGHVISGRTISEKLTQFYKDELKKEMALNPERPVRPTPKKRKAVVAEGEETPAVKKQKT